MADNSKIEWTDASWNPIRARNLKTGKVGWHCEHATGGCIFCYAEGFNKRLGTGLPFKPGHLDSGEIELFLDEAMLRQPLNWKRPRRIFVGSMTDLFARFVPDEWLFEIFAVMGACEDQQRGHEFQVLTKRGDRMRQWVTDHGSRAWNSCRLGPNAWPARNIWFGVSAERQDEYEERVTDLLRTPALVRFLSIEPLLGPITLFRDDLRGRRFNTRGEDITPSLVPGGNAKIDWVIVGGESGRNARAMHPDWPRALRDECAAAGTAFFFKQFGEWAPSTPEEAEGNPHSGWQANAAHPHVAKASELYPEAGAKFVARIGKKAAGRLLDGVEHNAFPRVPA